MLPTIYIYIYIFKVTLDRGPYSLHFPKYFIFMKYLSRPWPSLSANIILSIKQKRHISEHYSLTRSCMTQHLVWICNVHQVWQTANLGKDKENAGLHALTPVTNVKWFGTRSTPVSLAWPGSNCLPVTSPHKWERDKSRWISIDIYTCVKNNLHIKILRSVEIWLIGWVSEFVFNVPPTAQ